MGCVANQNNIIRRYLIRGGFEYKNGIVWTTQWGKSDTNLCDQAWFNALKYPISKAFVEVKEILHPVTVRVCECDGSIFRNFEWVAVALSPIKIKIGKEADVNKDILNNFRSEGESVGIVLVTQHKRLSFYVDGSMQQEIREHDNQDYKAIGGK